MRNRVVGCPERSLGYQSAIPVHLSRHRVNFRCLQCLLYGHRGDDRRHPLRQHRLARAGWPDHNGIMLARCSDHQCPLYRLLTLHIRKVQVVMLQILQKLLTDIDAGWFDIWPAEPWAAPRVHSAPTRRATFHP